MLVLAIDGIVSFSAVPLKIVTTVGLAFSALSVIGILYAIIQRLFTDIWVPGWTLIFITVLLIGGLQFIFLGVMGEYIGRIYSEAKNRPLFLVMEELGFDRAQEKRGLRDSFMDADDSDLRGPVSMARSVRQSS
jgi:dolichol-phosphate mannosyltransferase